MTCFTSGHLYHMQFAIPAAPNPAGSMAPSDFSSSVQGVLIYIVAETRGRLTKSYPVTFLNWWHHLHPAGSVQAQEHLECVHCHSTWSCGTNRPLKAVPVTLTLHERRIRATWALTLHICFSGAQHRDSHTAITEHCAAQHQGHCSNLQAQETQPPSPTDF